MHAQVRDPWYAEIGVNAVDVYPVGENMPQGPFFDEFLNVTDHWNFGFYLKVTRKLSQRFDVGLMFSNNTITKWGQFGNDDVSFEVEDLKYYGVDINANYYLLTNRLQPFVGFGASYTWIEEGANNTFSTNQGTDNLVGAMTINWGLGLKFTVSDHISINLQTTYKHSFQEYLTKHWQHTLGLQYRILGNKGCNYVR
ncbi:outer membrane beta-barrel protein [Gaetbulibacter jejuensis]|uniref:outer membrane beta-barrel protein n=1 Tax=Gaetbulibacter jejuensis TaxID=584607 RepID=UPI00300B1BC7